MQQSSVMETLTLFLTLTRGKQEEAAARFESRPRKEEEEEKLSCWFGTTTTRRRCVGTREGGCEKAAFEHFSSDEWMKLLTVLLLRNAKSRMRERKRESWLNDRRKGGENEKRKETLFRLMRESTLSARE